MEPASLKFDLLAKSGQWAIHICLLPLFLAAFGLGSLYILPIVATAAAALLLNVIHSEEWGVRFLTIDLLATLVVGFVAVYFTTVGDPTDLPLPLILSAILIFGSVGYVWNCERELDRRRADPRQGTSKRLTESICSRLTWNRGLAFATLVFVLTGGVSFWAFGDSVQAATYAWIVSSYSFGPLILLSLACIAGGRVRFVLTLATLLVLEVAVIWYIASTEVAIHQAYPLLWNDLVSRAEDPSSRGILIEGLVSWPAAFLTLGIFAGFPLLAKILGNLRPQTCCLTLIRVVTIFLVGGALFVRNPRSIAPRLSERYLEASSAPWAAIHHRELAPSRIDFDKARDLRTDLTEPIWGEGPATPLASLAGRYPRRSIVVVVLESHSLNNIAGFGEGAYRYQPSSPRFSRLVHEGLSFRNYYAPGFPTRDALWTALTGLPVPIGAPSAVERAPEATRLGRMKDFRALGYRCDWLYAGSPRFDNWDLLMSAAGVRWWIENQEVSELSREYWTSWGMPDGDLYGIVLGRFRKTLAESQPAFFGILTVSNHEPYSFPTVVDGQEVTRDHRGGMRYADHSLWEFIRALRALPRDHWPIVFVTSDTSYIQNLRDAEPVGHLGLEGVRIPGLLLLPDGYLAGETYEGVFCHEDLLDLMYFLVQPGEGGVNKFRDRHREVAFANGHQIFTRDTYYAASFKRWFAIRDYWRLEETSAPPQRVRVQKAWEKYLEDMRSLWFR